MSTTKEKGFSKFGKSFQENLVRIMFEDRSFCRQIAEVLETQFFELKYLQIFVQKLEEYHSKYGLYPTITAMTSIIKAEIEEDDITKKQVRDFFTKIITATEPLDDEEYVKETSLEFCKKKKLQEALMKSVQLVEKSKFSEIKNLIESALKLGNDNNFGHDYKIDFDDRYKEITRSPISTGLPAIDKLTQGGFGKGELAVIVASTGSGKTVCQCFLAANALKQGKNVVYYTLELSESAIGQRIDSHLSQIPLDDLLIMKEEVYKSVVEVKGKLLVKQYPARHASLDTIRNHLNRLIVSGFKPDLVVVDYADLLKPTTSREQKHTEREEIYEELRGLSVEYEIAIISASQTNRSGINVDVITLDAIADAYAKCFTADFIITLSRTMDDRKLNRGRFFIAKNRNGIDGIVLNIRVDTATSTFEVLSEQDDEKNHDDAKIKLQKIYGKFKEEMGLGK